MSNYYKSEMYRVLRDKRIYLLIAGCSLLMIAMNVVLAIAGNAWSDFRYATVDFSLNMLGGEMSMAMVVALVFAGIVFADEYKNRTISNCRAFGLSTTKIMLGKLFVTFTVALPAMAVVEAVLIGSAYLLLEHSGMAPIFDLLRADVACLPLFAAAVSIFIVLLFWLQNEMTAIWTWLGVVVLGSKAVELLGMKISFFKWLSNCMIYPLASGVIFDEELGSYCMMWDRASGMFHVILVGVITTLAALCVGVMVSRRKR